MPTRKHAVGAMDERLGSPDAMRAFEKTIIAAKPTSPGNIKRNGVTEAENSLPKTTGIKGGTTTMLASRHSNVTNAAERNARSVWPVRAAASLRAASGRSAVETAPGK